MVYLCLAEGFEEVEAITVVDILRRGEVPVKTVGVGGLEICGTHGVCVRADLPIEEANEPMEMLILPGGQPGTENLYQSAAVRERIEEMDVAQGKLAIGLRTGCTAADAEYPALLMMNAVFGAGTTSKLFVKVREELSLCYYAGASIEKFKGVMFVSSGVESANFETAKKEILRQLEQCREGNISAYEFDSAKRLILSELKAAADSPGRLDDFYVGNAAAGIGGTVETLAERVAAVTVEDVVAAARRVTLDSVYFLKGAEA